MNDEDIANFAQSLRGPVIGRDHPEYEEARKLYNAMIDKRPLLIARCADVADIRALSDEQRVFVDHGVVEFSRLFVF